MTIKKYIWLGLALLAGHASAQVLFTDPDWKESEAPPPPAFNQGQLLPITMPSYVSLQFGLDPATLRITPDGIIRYVVVASNATGSLTAMYEGIQCATWKVKTYARYATNGQWSLVKEPKWQDLGDNLPSKHAIALARQGICESGSIAASSVANIVQSLKNKR
jgi:hypothetical protein